MEIQLCFQAKNNGSWRDTNHSRVFSASSAPGAGHRGAERVAHLSGSSPSCMLNSMEGISLSMCWGSQMMACNSSFTVFLTTPWRPLIPATRILTKTHKHKRSDEWRRIQMSSTTSAQTVGLFGWERHFLYLNAT